MCAVCKRHMHDCTHAQSFVDVWCYVCVWLFHVEHSLGCGNLMSPPDWDWQPWWGASSICVEAEKHKSHLSVSGLTVKWRVHVTNGSQCLGAERASRITLKDVSGGLPDIMYIWHLFLWWEQVVLIDIFSSHSPVAPKVAFNKGVVRYLGKYAYSLSGWKWDKRINTT